MLQGPAARAAVQRGGGRGGANMGCCTADTPRLARVPSPLLHRQRLREAPNAERTEKLEGSSQFLGVDGAGPILVHKLKALLKLLALLIRQLGFDALKQQGLQTVYDGSLFPTHAANVGPVTRPQPTFPCFLSQCATAEYKSALTWERSFCVFGGGSAILSHRSPVNPFLWHKRHGVTLG